MRALPLALALRIATASGFAAMKRAPPPMVWRMLGWSCLLPVSLSLSLACNADNLRFLKSSPLSYFKGQDYELMQKNARAILDVRAVPAKQDWSNRETGSSGFAEVRSEFINTDGAPCKRLRIVNRAGGMESDAVYAVCKYEGRGWLIHPDAVPLKPGHNE